MCYKIMINAKRLLKVKGIDYSFAFIAGFRIFLDSEAKFTMSSGGRYVRAPGYFDGSGDPEEYNDRPIDEVRDVKVEQSDEETVNCTSEVLEMEAEDDEEPSDAECPNTGTRRAVISRHCGTKTENICEGRRYCRTS